MNPFTYRTVAERYAKGRPEFHSLVVEKIRKKLLPAKLVARALDVACGTGMSSRTLRAVAERVDGVDSSQAMLDYAAPMDGVFYHCGPAEQLAFADDTFDLLTVSSALHWFDRNRFLAEAQRVLRDNGMLVIYENGFPGRMLSNPEFSNWQQAFYKRFPNTPRDSSPLTDDDATAFGLRFLQRENYANSVEFTPAELAMYLSTQSNAIEAIERGSTSAEDLRAWILGDVSTYFDGTEREAFEFRGVVWYLRKDGAD